jgi:hypothetical protein
MKIIAFVVFSFFAGLALIFFSFYYLDTHVNVLPSNVSEALRKSIGYCIDGRKIYYAKKPFTIEDGCRVCVCVPELGGVTCKLNHTIPACLSVSK